MSFETAVQQMVYAALTGVVTVYDAVPQGAAYPYATIGEGSVSEWDTVSDTGADCSVTIHTWSRGRGRKEIKAMQGLIFAALHDQTFIVSGFNVVSVYFENSNSFMDADGLTRHGVQSFRVLIERT